MTQYIYPDEDVIAGLESTGELLRLFLPIWVLKENNRDATSDTTFSDDPGLSIEGLKASGVYQIQFLVKFAGDLDGDIKTNWTLPAGASGSRLCMGPATGSTDASADNIALRVGVHAVTTSIAYACTRDSLTLSQWLWESGIIVMGDTDGDITFSWAQNTSSATATRVTANSVGSARRIA